MARTKNPHAATVKAWETRRRNEKADPVAPKGDYGAEVARVSGLPLASADELASAVTIPDATPGSAATGPVIPTITEIRQQDRIEEAVKAGLALQDVPRVALDGLAGGIQILPTRAFLAPQELFPPRLPSGDYSLHHLRVRVNAGRLLRLDEQGYEGEYAQPGSPSDRLQRAAGKLVMHEIGHHAYLSRLTDAAAIEWSKISMNGWTCHVTEYGRKNSTEHFSEAFAAYAQPDAKQAFQQFHRDHLKAVSPEAHAFMERLWRTPSMWMPNGKASPKPDRATYGKYARAKAELRLAYPPGSPDEA